MASHRSIPSFKRLQVPGTRIKSGTVMPRKEISAPSAGRGRSLIATRKSQQQQRKMQGPKSHLPRSNSSPAPQNDPTPSSSPNKSYVLRSFSSPESKPSSSRRDSRSLHQDSRSELDSDLESFEQFEDSLLDIDADIEDGFGHSQRSLDTDGPKRVVTTLLPGSGLQRISLRPITSNILQTPGIREAQKKIQKGNAEDNSKFY